MTDPVFLTISEAAALIASKKLSATELVTACITKTKKLDPQLDSYITFTPESALEAAKAADSEIAKGVYRGPMHGIPIGLKDIYDTAGVRTTAHSKLLADRVPTKDAFTVAQLKTAGAIICGKLGTYEFAMGGPSFDVLSAPARNPWDPSRTTAGSSSGSGAAVAAGLCLGATGSDTAGSIRGPAAHCALTGIKPTYGLLSRSGILPLAQSMDHAGPLCWTSHDAALMLQAMTGYDAQDPACASRDVPDYTAKLGQSLRGKTIGLVRHFYEKDHVASAAVIAGIESALTVFKELGCKIVDVTLPPLYDFTAAGMVIMLAEAFAIHEESLTKSPELYGENARDRLVMGAFIGSIDYMHALQRRRELALAVNAAAANVDVLLTATVPSIAAKMTEVPKWSFYEKPSYSTPTNITGQPAMAVCCGFSPEGMPLSIQIIGRAFDEQTVFQFGDAYEKATTWRSRRPAIALTAA
jgi:aspartyl-tRNA(Asn)/glutamyl-tRNA(Gln) amidotransferase subunit A